MAEKPEIQKQQKTTTYSWVHLVNRLVQICSKVYESSSETWQSHTKHAWSKQKLYICLGSINIPKLNSCSSSSRQMITIITSVVTCHTTIEGLLSKAIKACNSIQVLTIKSLY